MRNTTKNTMIGLGAAAVLALASCGNKESAEDNPSAGESSALQGVFLEEAPPNALNSAEARKDPTPGREVTISGEIMGSLDPIIEGRALVMIGDPTKLTPCNRIPGDACETPWDVCCDDPDVIKTSIATVQVLDAEGRPLKEGLRGLSGLKELSFLTVTGTVAEGSNADNYLVNATGIHVAKESPFKNAPPVNPTNIDHHDHEEDHDHAEDGHDDHHES